MIPPDSAVEERIRSEEVYRLQVQQQLLQQLPQSNGIWAFVNSAFGLWLLSSVVLACVTFFFQSNRESQQRWHADALELRDVCFEMRCGLRDFRDHVKNHGFTYERYSGEYSLFFKEGQRAKLPSFRGTSWEAMLHRMEFFQDNRYQSISKDLQKGLLQDLWKPIGDKAGRQENTNIEWKDKNELDAALFDVIDHRLIPLLDQAEHLSIKN